MKTAPCKECQSIYHTKNYHTVKERKPMNRGTSTLKTTKPMKQKGRVTNEWLKTRREWVKLNPPNHQNYYQCHICGGMVEATGMELDHVVSRSRAPELRFVLSNLKPSHSKCNRDKASKNMDEL